MMNKLLCLDANIRIPPAFQAMALLVVSALFCLSDAHAGTESDDTISASSVVFTQAKRDAIAAPDILPDQGEGARAAALSEEDKRFRTQALIWGGAGAVVAYGAANWWKDGFSGHFRTTNEGWFGQDTYTGGADKMGHAYAPYVGTRLLARAFEWAGHDRDSSLYLSAATVFGTLLAVETLDGFSNRYKFSKEDLIMNAVGTGLGLLFEKNKRLDDLFDFRLHYWPSGDAKRLNQVGPIGDHSGQTYLLVAKATGIPQLRNHDVLRYFELAAGYGTRGYEPNEGAPAPDRSRHVYFGISLNISEILSNTVFRDSAEKSRSQRVTETVLEYVQVPGTAVLADHRL
ncbi:MAG: YfiM family protein [Sulfuricella sp.]|nr:YfiM family protein [Sulfuricella sp.]